MSKRQAKAKAEPDPSLEKIYTPREETPLEQREMLFMDRLFKALEGHGIQPKTTSGYDAYVEIGGAHRTPFRIWEKHRRFRRSYTAKDWRFALPNASGMHTDHRPTGRLVFFIDSHMPSECRRRWEEVGSKTLEEWFPAIVDSFVRARSIFERENREKAIAERQRRFEIEAESENLRNEERERERWEKFVALAYQQRKVAVARRFLAKIKQTPGDDRRWVGDRDMAEWLRWAERQLEKFDPLTSGAEKVFETIYSVGEPDSDEEDEYGF